MPHLLHISPKVIIAQNEKVYLLTAQNNGFTYDFFEMFIMNFIDTNLHVYFLKELFFEIFKN